MNTMQYSLDETEKGAFGMNSRKFSLWIFLVSVTMLFAGLTSALVVKRAGGNWLSIHIPVVFFINTAIIVLSSVSLQFAYYYARKDEVDKNRIALWITMLLGIGFIIGQFYGYSVLVSEKTFLVGKEINGELVHNPSASFFYVISGLHAVHVIGGVFFIMATLFAAYKYKVHRRSMLRINMCATYWHYMGALWVYLFIVLNVLQ